MEQLTITTNSCFTDSRRINTHINQYLIEKVLGRGKFAEVKLVYDINIKEKFAMKIIEKTKLKRRKLSMNKTQLNLIEKEVIIMKKMGHPHVVKLIEIIDDPKIDKMYLIQEYMQEGDLQKRLDKG